MSLLSLGSEQSSGASCPRQNLLGAGRSTSWHSRNPLEQPWTLSEVVYVKKSAVPDMKVFRAARDETIALTEEIAVVEKEIDERVAALYGL